MYLRKMCKIVAHSALPGKQANTDWGSKQKTRKVHPWKFKKNHLVTKITTHFEENKAKQNGHIRSSSETVWTNPFHAYTHALQVANTNRNFKFSARIYNCCIGFHFVLMRSNVFCSVVVDAIRWWLWTIHLMHIGVWFWFNINNEKKNFILKIYFNK